MNSTVGLNAAGLNFTEFANLQAFVRAGGGVIAIHGGTDSMQNVPWYMDLVGAGFTNHGSNQGGILIDTESGGHVELVNADPAQHGDGRDARPVLHGRRAVQHEPRPVSTGIAHPLVYENEDSLIGQLGYGTGALMNTDQHAMVWCRNFDGGRSFTTTLNHNWQFNTAAWFQQQMLAAVQWTAGVGYVNCVTFNEVRNLIASDLAAGKITQAGADALNAKLDEAEAAKEAGLIQRSLNVLDQFVNIAKKPSTSAAPTEACPNACLKDAREELAFKGRELKDWIKGFK